MRPLLYLHLRQSRNALLNLKRTDLVRVAILALLFMGVIASAVAFSVHGFSYILRLPLMADVVLASLVDILFFVLFHLLLISNLLLSYTYLFRTQGASFSFALPMQPHWPFYLRALQAVVQSSWATFLLVGAVLVSLGITLKAPSSYYVGLPCVLCAFLLLCAAVGLGAALVLAFLRKKLGRKAFSAAGIVLLAGGIAYLASQVGTLAFRSGEELIFLARLRERLSAMHSPFWPGKWASGAVLAFANGLPRHGWFSCGLLAATAFFLWPFLDLSGRHLYLRLWQELSEESGTGRRHQRAPRPAGPLRAILWKDFLLFVRDPAQSLQLVLFLLLMALYSLSLLQFPRAFLVADYADYVSVANVAAISFILGSFSSRFVYPLLGTEGKAVWILGVVPQEVSVLIRAKLAAGFAIMVPVAIALSVSSHAALGLGGAGCVAGTLFVVVLAFALATVALAFSAAFADFRSNRPAEVLGSFGGTANFLASSSVVVAAGALWIASTLAGGSTPLGACLLLGAFLLPATVAFGAYRVALRSFHRREFW